MKSKREIHKTFKAKSNSLEEFIVNFDTKGEDFGNQERNSLKLFKIR